MSIHFIHDNSSILSSAQSLSNVLSVVSNSVTNDIIQLYHDISV